MSVFNLFLETTYVPSHFRCISLAHLYGHSVQVLRGLETCTDTVRSVRSGADAHAQVSIACQPDFRTAAISARQLRAASPQHIVYVDQPFRIQRLCCSPLTPTHQRAVEKTKRTFIMGSPLQNARTKHAKNE